MSVESNNRYFKVTTDRSCPGKVIVSSTLSKDAPIGGLRDEIMIRFKGLQDYAVPIPAVCEITSRYRVFPASLDFGNMSSSARITRECVIKPMREGDRIEVLEISADLTPAFTASIEPAGSEFRLVGTFTPRTDFQSLEGYVRLKLTAKGAVRPYYFHIPVVGLVKKAPERT